MDRGRVSAAGLRVLVHQRQAQALARVKVTQDTHAERVFSDGSSLVTVHPGGWPEGAGCV
jgi:urease gamma subunit